MPTLAKLLAPALPLLLTLACGGADAAASAEKGLVSSAVSDVDEECDLEAIGVEGGDQQCELACKMVDCCASEVGYDECLDRCEASTLVPGRDRCLAMRVLWVDEEGCESIVGTYDVFDDDDDCTGPTPY